MRHSLLVVTLLLAALATGAVAQDATSQEDVVVVTVDSTNLRF